MSQINVKTMRSVFVAAFAAIICVAGFISIPMGPLGVPIVLQNMMVTLSALVLGGIQGGAAVGLFLIAGLIGIPVFASGRVGFAAFLSPTGGYIIGYFVGSMAAGIFIGRPSIEEKKITRARVVKTAAAGVICVGIDYLLGLGHMVRNLGMSIPAAIAAGALPFLPGDAVKLVVSVALALRLRPIAARYIGSEDA